MQIWSKVNGDRLVTSQMDSLPIYHAILDAAVDAIIVSNEKGSIANLNSATLSLFGYTRDELIGENVKILMPDDMAALHDGFLAHHVETGEEKIIGSGRDLEAKRRDGSLFPIHLSVGRVEIEDELFFVGIMHDLTERRKAQEIAARAQRMDAIGQLTGGVAHDFNNLLTVVIGNLELLDGRLNDDGEKELLGDALEAAELGADLTARLLGLARRHVPEAKAVDVNEAARALETVLGRTLGPKIDFSMELTSEIWDVSAEPSGLQTALLNLVLNARDAMPNGGRLTLETENAKIDDPFIVSETGILPGDYVKISVSDTGLGMDAETKRRAFEPFYTTKPKDKGTGFGLSMVYGFMQQSNGHVTLYSEIGQGSTFNLYFPTSDLHEQTEAPLGVIDGLKGRGEHILVVEDNAQVRKLSTARLRELGYKVIEAETGDIALERLKTEQDIALVFSDVVMPGKLSGFGLADRVARDFPHIKILLTSGYSDSQMPENGTDVHVYPMLRKPFRLVELAAMLQTLLSDV